MVNLCEGCKKTCCKEIILTQEVTDPVKFQEFRREFPFFRRVRTEIKILPGHREVAVGIYNCDKFDPSIGICTIHGGRRPKFCEEAGVRYPPVEGCLHYARIQRS